MVSLERKRLSYFQHDVRTIIKDGKIYRYPDVVVAPKTDNSDSHHVKEPIVMIEVFSDGSSKTDHEEKLKEYAAMPTVQHYLIISQYEMSVKIYTRQAKGWHYEHFTELEDMVDFPNLDCSLQLKDVYEEVDLAENRSDS